MAKIVSVSEITYQELVKICRAENKEADEMVKALIHERYIQSKSKPKKELVVEAEPKEELVVKPEVKTKEHKASKHSGRYPWGSKEEPTE